MANQKSTSMGSPNRRSAQAKTSTRNLNKTGAKHTPVSGKGAKGK